MKTYSRKQLHAELTKAIIERLESLDVGPGDAVAACRVMRALVHCAADVAEAADASPGVLVEQVRRVLGQRLPRLKPSKAVLVMKPGSC